MTLSGLRILHLFYCYFPLQVLHFDSIAGLGGSIQTKVQKPKVHSFLSPIFLPRIENKTVLGELRIGQFPSQILASSLSPRHASGKLKFVQKKSLLPPKKNHTKQTKNQKNKAGCICCTSKKVMKQGIMHYLPGLIRACTPGGAAGRQHMKHMCAFLHVHLLQLQR